jgi:NADPH:quinone reductase-like Zn-dependent oxidoreductase
MPTQPGDCVIINAANSIVGRTLLQLCKLLKLRCVAVLRCRSSGTAGGSADSSDARFAATAEQLQALGATLVLKDEGSIKVGLMAEAPA